jgi:hypothetical protein
VRPGRRPGPGGLSRVAGSGSSSVRRTVVSDGAAPKPAAQQAERTKNR